MLNYEFDTKNLVSLVISGAVGVWYVLKKVGGRRPGPAPPQGRPPPLTFLPPVTSQHWIANNLFGLAFALNGVELLHLNNVSTGCILLGGLFVYDVFWVSRHVCVVRRRYRATLFNKRLVSLFRCSGPTSW